MELMNLSGRWSLKYRKSSLDKSFKLLIGSTSLYALEWREDTYIGLTNYLSFKLQVL